MGDPWGEATGFMANVNRGLGIGDALAAAFRTSGNVATGRTPLNGVRADYSANLARQHQLGDAYLAARPTVANLARGVGGAAMLGVPSGEATNIFARLLPEMSPRAADLAGNTAVWAAFNVPDALGRLVRFHAPDEASARRLAGGAR